eukprot:COSAG01_NODE_4491_length_4978_cov_17.492109_4_plen_255_part_00
MLEGCQAWTSVATAVRLHARDAGASLAQHGAATADAAATRPGLRLKVARLQTAVAELECFAEASEAGAAARGGGRVAAAAVGAAPAAGLGLAPSSVAPLAALAAGSDIDTDDDGGDGYDTAPEDAEACARSPDAWRRSLAQELCATDSEEEEEDGGARPRWAGARPHSAGGGGAGGRAVNSPGSQPAEELLGWGGDAASDGPGGMLDDGRQEHEAASSEASWAAGHDAATTAAREEMRALREACEFSAVCSRRC